MGSLFSRARTAVVLGLAIASIVAGVRTQTRPSVSPVRTISVSSEPGAKVWIDGVLYGTTDKTGTLEIRSIASGAHTLKVRADGFKERSQPLSAAARGAVKVPLVKRSEEHTSELQSH